MHNLQRREMMIKHTITVAAVALLCLCKPAISAYTINVAEIGGNVVATGAGSLNLNAFGARYAGSTLVAAWPGNGELTIGGRAAVLNTVHVAASGGVLGPILLGMGSAWISANSSTGDLVGMRGSARMVVVPDAYISGDPLTSSATWNSHTFASLGLTPGTYTWTWGAGATADSFTVQIGPKSAAPTTTANIPTLSEWALIGLSGLVALFGLARVRRSAAARRG